MGTAAWLGFRPPLVWKVGCTFALAPPDAVVLANIPLEEFESDVIRVKRTETDLGTGGQRHGRLLEPGEHP